MGWLEIVAGGHVFHQKWDLFFGGDVKQAAHVFRAPILWGFLSKINSA